MPTDQELMKSLARGDDSALQPLYDRHRKLLFSMALRVTGDAGSAEELLQDTFCQLWQKARQFDTARGSLIGWLLVMTRHRAISRLRQNRERLSREALCEDNIAGIQNSGSTVLERQIAHELVYVALAGLPKVQLEAITLAYFDGLTCEEIASHTGSPVGTVKWRLRTALKAMKGALSNPKFSTPSELTQLPPTLESVLITEELHSRGSRERNSEQESECLHRLVQAAALSPEALIDCFLKMPLDLCRAGTAGLSLLETDASGKPIFRWTNLAGKLANAVGGTTPRNFSPCGITLDRDSPQLFAYPGRYFTYFNQVAIPIIEGLVIPFHVGPRTEGTIWIVSHDPESRFDAEDVRIMTSLAEFAGCALHLVRLFGAVGLEDIQCPEVNTSSEPA